MIEERAFYYDPELAGYRPVRSDSNITKSLEGRTGGSVAVLQRACGSSDPAHPQLEPRSRTGLPPASVSVDRTRDVTRVRAQPQEHI
jgi:hypothetical protein